ncbi:MAG: hypothetical protein J5534_04675 [Fibrobacter sp.]|nr:hypothetical protein [Fibrobacter sp.]
MKLSARSIIFGMFIWFFIGTGVVELFPVLSPMKYLPDICIVVLLLCGKKNTIGQSYNPFSRIILCALFLETLVSYWLHYENWFYYVWGLRNLFRFFLYLHVCIRFLKKSDFAVLCKITLAFLLVNTPIMFYQGAIMKLFGDNVGGLFGTVTGANGYTNIHLVLSTIIAVTLYSKRNISIVYLLTIFLCCFLQAALSELKFYYVEFVVIVVGCFLFSKEKQRLTPLFWLSIIVLMIGVLLINYFYPSYESFFNFDTMMEYSERSYGSRNAGIDRTTALPIIKMNFLSETKDFLLGIGLGNAEYTQLYTPDFIARFGYFRIYFFSHAMLFLETGIIGIVLYALFFINYLVSRFPQRNKMQDLVGMSLIPLIFCICVYNQSMRIESAFLVYTFLAMPYARDEVEQ